jgi:cysteine-rich repeat protein
MAVLIAPACTPASVSGATPPGGGGNGAGGGGGGTNGGGGSGPGIISTQAPPRDAGPPATGKACGNSVIDINQGENCDDGNTDSGDGCNRICQTEANWNCPTPGQKCENLAKCGNSILTSDEVCDDGNTVSGDGCSADCKTVEPGWQCRVPGKPCNPSCGDGVVTAGEICDDGNTVSGDGCSATCKLEIGYKCTGSSGQKSVCSATVCGDGKTEGAEGCDDGNTVPFDGCSEDCQIEPDCSHPPCTSKCGDGIVLNEACDDGNQANGDGCSKTCQVEPGWTCTQPTLGDTMMVPVIYRDFKFHNPSDFEAGVIGQNVATLGEVNSDLDQDGKPVFSGLATAHIASTTTFAEWYRTTSGVNHATATKLALWKNADGNYVNRYGPNGEQWNVTEPANWCGSVGQELLDANGKPIPCSFQYQQSATNPTGGQTDCQKEEAKGYTQVPGSCKNNGSGTYVAEYVVAKVDGNPLFFPIDNDPFSAAELEAAQVPSVPLGLYDASGTWPWDVDANGNKVMHNFSFTGEFRYWFKYDSTKSYTLDFVGDDDVWVFINRTSWLSTWAAFTLPSTAGIVITPTNARHTQTPIPAECNSRVAERSVPDRGLPNRAPDHLLVVQADAQRLQCGSQRLHAQVRGRRHGGRRRMRLRHWNRAASCGLPGAQRRQHIRRLHHPVQVGRLLRRRHRERLGGVRRRPEERHSVWRQRVHPGMHHDPLLWRQCGRHRARRRVRSRRRERWRSVHRQVQAGDHQQLRATGATAGRSYGQTHLG